MILYLAPGACSLADHIALHEAGLNFDQVKVDLKTHRTEDGRDYTVINPKGYVPALLLNSGEILTENIAILSWISDQTIPALFGDFVRYRLLEALAYFSTEIHKSFKPYFTPGAIWGMSVKLGLGCPLCGHLGHSGVVEADSDHETVGDTISRARLSQPRWNTFKHRCKRDRNPCHRPPPTGA